MSDENDRREESNSLWEIYRKGKISMECVGVRKDKEMMFNLILGKEK